jgi:uncharacterized protein
MNLAPVFVDTWGWMALGHRRDPQHGEVRDLYRQLREEQIPITTSDYVLDELITLLFRRESFDEQSKKSVPIREICGCCGGARI